MSATDFVEEELRRLELAGQLRIPDSAADQAVLAQHLAAQGRPVIDVSSNDYLGFARQSVSRETLPDPACRAGAGASRLIFGTHPAHDLLETELARWLGYPTALLFSSGYAANVGVLSALAGPGDLIVSDALNHASIIDGCRLSRAEVRVVPHRSISAVAQALQAPARRRFVVTEAYFSMDGNGPDLRALAHLVRESQSVWILDEAHSLGVFGPQGRGLAAEALVTPDLLIGTLGKAFGLQGAFVATHPLLRTLLWNRARSLVYSTATSPLLATLARLRLPEVVAATPARAHLAALATEAHLRLRDLSLPTTADRPGPILPVLVEPPELATQAAMALRQNGFLARAIRPPTVPPGTARLRLVLHSDLTFPDLSRLLHATATACRP
ncbi:MAG: 8-amino-7-oxononanoate synthase [Polyangiaceae bacterium]|nr:8-amino-7-oxononanoate synthase [Polyangiaceae bacterium]